jgi:hypothetical protein
MMNKIVYLLLFGISILSCRKGTINSVYQDVNCPEFTYSEFKLLKKIANKDTDLIEVLPRKLSSSILNNNFDTISCKRVLQLDDINYSLAEFYVIKDSVLHILLVTFKPTGESVDCLFFKNKRNVNGEWNAFFTDFYYTDTNSFEINTLDVNNEAKHPSLSKILKKKKYYINSDGQIIP